MSKFFRRLLDTLYVRPCLICGKPVKVSEKINMCKECVPVAERYGLSITTAGNVTVSVLPYTGYIRKAMFKFKFRNKKYYGFTFAEIMYLRILKMPWYKNIDCVACVPMKGRERLYNQSAVIAEGIAERLGVPFAENSLVKLRTNPPFYKLSYKERMRLVVGAYDIGCDLSFKGKRVLLVDDILTTGVTVNECRRVLMKNGAVEVYCATACYVGKKNRE